MTMQPRRKRRTVRPAQIAKAIDEGRESLDLYLDEISKVPLLTREEEMELARRAFRGNVAAQERLARHNVRFVVSVAKKFQNRGVPLVDLIGEDNMMWGSDYPHAEGTWGFSNQIMQQMWDALGPVAGAKVLGGNAAKLWGI